MEIILETKAGAVDSRRVYASAHLIFGGGSMTISNILVRRNDTGKVEVKFPVYQMQGHFKPLLTMQKQLKEIVTGTLQADALRAWDAENGKSASRNTYDEDYRLAEAERLL